jgi:formate dehydrogenase maturation protein FdhE
MLPRLFTSYGENPMNKIKIELNLDNEGLESILQTILIKGLQPAAQMAALAAIEQQQGASEQESETTIQPIGFNTESSQ